MSGFVREPLEAKVLDDPAPLPPRRRGGGLGWLVASVAFALFIVCFAGLLWGLGQLLNRAGATRISRSDGLVGRWDATSERWTNIRSALEESRSDAQAESRDLARFFEKLQAALSPGSQTSFMSLVDLEGCAERVLTHPASRARSRSDRGLLEQKLEHLVHAPGTWSELVVLRTERSTRGDEAQAYTIALFGNEPPTVLRWWLRRDGRNWKLCDWERLDRGWTEAERWALEGASEGTPEHDAYRNAIAKIQNAEQHLQTEHIAVGAQHLLDISAVAALPAALHDLALIELAWAWEHAARSDQVLAAVGRLRDPAAYPASGYLRALAYSRREDFAAASAAAAQYRAAAGRHPHVLEIEATALEALGQRLPAAECWWQRLELLPEDTDALREFCRLAGEDGAARAATLLARARRPQEFAQQVARAAIYRDDDATAQAVERFFQNTAPQAAALDLIAGWRLEQGGQYEQAARRFGAAADKAAHPDDRHQYWQSSLEADARAGRAAQAVAAAADPRAALEYLTAGLEYNEAVLRLADLPPLVASERGRDPENPRLRYLEGLLALEDHNWSAAERHLRAALAGAMGKAAGGDDLAELCLNKLREALYRQKRLASAYQLSSAAEASPGFRELAWLCQEDGNWPALGELIRLHRGQQPSDPWIHYFLALEAQAAGDAAAALKAVERAESATDEALRQTLAWLKNQLLIESGGISQAYSNSSDQREAFRRLTTHLVNQGDWAGVLELAKLHSAQAPRRSSTLYWMVAAHWHLGEYQAVVDNLTPWPEDRVARLESGQLTELCDLLVRSLLRLGKLKEAEAAAARARDEYGIEPPLVAMTLAKGDRAELLELLAHPRIARAVFAQQLYRDSDLATLLTVSDVAGIRRGQAVPTPSDQGPRNVSLVLLFEKAVTEEEVTAVVSGTDGNGTSGTHVTATHPAATASYLFDCGPEALVLTAGRGSYCAADQIPKKWSLGEARRKILEEHRGWVALDLLLADDPLPASDVPRLAAALAASLEKLQPLAIYFDAPRSHRLDVCDRGLRARLSSGEYVAAALARPAAGQRSTSETVVLFPGAGTEPSVAERSALSKAVRRLADSARVENAAGHALVRIELHRGHAAEFLWVKVIRSRRQEYGQDEFIAELTSDSRLWPFLRSGERLRLDGYEVLEVGAPAESPPSKPPSK